LRKIAPLVILLAARGMVGSAEPGDERGRFYREYWYEPGIEHGNPRLDSRFRVNAPEVVLDPRFMYRSEVRENGLMMILIEEDLARLVGAELYLELWGGHPGSGEKRVTVNGRSTYVLPDVGSALSCTHSYPTVPLKVTDLVNGYNALQFAVDQGEAFWGHFIVDGAALRVELPDVHPDLAEIGIQGFEARVSAAPARDEMIDLALGGEDLSRVSRVDYEGRYEGYDENGNTQTLDWHGFTREREPVAHLGTASEPPFSLTWDTSMVPGQEDMAVRALVRFQGHPELRYVTAATEGLHTVARDRLAVSLHHCVDLPRPFWSRAGQRRRCRIELDVDPPHVERAELNVVLWDGGRGTVDAYFTLNGVPLAVAGGGHHDVLHRIVPLDPSVLRRGFNHVELLSDTEHHGIEILLPGPALAVRAAAKRTEAHLE
jgi:hypothetical protein